MNWSSSLPTSLLELILPEQCSLCDAVKGTVSWCPKGPLLKGLRPWDGPHLCAQCLNTVKSEVGACHNLEQSAGAPVPVVAGQWTNASLVDLVSQWKYKGLRGLVWPLTQLLVPALSKCTWINDLNVVWVPLPLHGRRQRERGFNQAHLLADQLAVIFGGRVEKDLAVRLRSTGQQAKLNSDRERAENLRNAFGPGKGLDCLAAEKGDLTPKKAPKPLILVDDLVTSGATVDSLVSLMQSRGLAVEAIVCLGVASAEARNTTGY